MSEVFIFGYGSLINSESRSDTAQTGEGLPCIVEGLKREWNFHGPFDSSSGLTAVGLIIDSNSSTNGVIAPLTEAELAKFDEREKGYQRIEVDSKRIRFLRENPQITNSVWTYVPENPQLPDQSYPIAQTYVDLILIGCLNYGREFAKDFIKTTGAWSYPWVDDRNNPIYPGFARIHPHAQLIDNLLQQIIPDEFAQRKSLTF